MMSHFYYKQIVWSVYAVHSTVTKLSYELRLNPLKKICILGYTHKALLNIPIRKLTAQLPEKLESP